LTEQLPELLTVTEVRARYGLKDRRAARRVMDDAGGFLVAGNLYVAVADLAAHEARLRASRKPPPLEPPPNLPARRRRSAAAVRKEPLPPGWWRNPPAA
jgi:hypothetical protein